MPDDARTPDTERQPQPADAYEPPAADDLPDQPVETGAAISVL
jgi:hypothetical protein